MQDMLVMKSTTSPEAQKLLRQWEGRVELQPDLRYISTKSRRYGHVFAQDDKTITLSWRGDDEHKFLRNTGACIESSDGTMRDWHIAAHEMRRFSADAAQAYVDVISDEKIAAEAKSDGIDWRKVMTDVRRDELDEAGRVARS